METECKISVARSLFYKKNGYFFVTHTVHCAKYTAILRTWNSEKKVKRTLYVHKAGARKLLISKELPISKNGDGV